MNSTSIWSEQLSAGALAIRSSAIRDLLKLTEQPETISFAGGLPAPEFFPQEEIAAAAERVLAEQPIAALQYGPTEGLSPLRSLLAERMAALGVNVPAAQVLISSGSQQGLDLLGKLFLEPGALVAVENPTYLGALQAWRPYCPDFLTLPMDEQGLDVGALEAALAGGARPRFLYLVSCFQNPTGITLAPARRAALIELAGRYSLPIVEDDPYGELSYSGARPPILAALDVERHGELRHVLYLSTFSKLLAPGLRVGWVIAPREIVDRLSYAKQGLDLHSGSLAQAIALQLCREGLLERHIPTLRAIYQARRDAMLAALDEHMPAGVRWTRPEGGMFVWVTLPENHVAADLLKAALEQHVAFVPGDSFFANGGGSNTLRLNFTHAPPARIAEGIARLGRAMRG